MAIVNRKLKDTNDQKESCDIRDKASKSGYVMKPVIKSELAQTMRRILDGQNRQQDYPEKAGFTLRFDKQR